MGFRYNIKLIIIEHENISKYNVEQGIVDGSASKLALRQDTGYMVPAPADFSLTVNHPPPPSLCQAQSEAHGPPSAMAVRKTKTLASIFGSLKYIFPKCTFLGHQLSRRGLVWYLFLTANADRRP